jgi:hypothetical protein
MGSQRNLNLSLWEEEPSSAAVAGTARLNWSYSRREAAEQCLRRYFYQYYSNCVTDSSLRDQIQRIKEIKNRHLRIGELVHLAISTYFKKLKQGKTLTPAWVERWVAEIFAGDQAYSKRIKSGGPASNDKYPPTVMDEIVNGVPDGDRLLNEAGNQLRSAVQMFFTADSFEEFRRLGAQSHSLVEHKLSLGGYGVPVSGKIDLAVRDENVVRIIDWKLGVASDGGAESLQLASYGLWAKETYEIPSDQIRIAKAHLADGTVVEFRADEESFANAQARIHQDLERMTVLHTYGQAGTIDAFTPSPHAKLCRLCPFRQICPEGEGSHD